MTGSSSIPIKQSPGLVMEPCSTASIAWLPWIFLLIGVALRLAQYMANRSLWLDESYLALNILHRSFWQLLEPLDYNQGAPLAFLMIEKLIIQIFGSSEYALRFFPFLCGIMSLFLFHNLVKHLLHTRGILLAMSLFAISWPLIYYSSELKQYSTDVTVALLLYCLIFYTLRQDRLDIFSCFLLGTTGSLALWFSHPALFILAGIGFGLILHRIRHPQWASMIPLLLLILTWVISFLFVYLISISQLTENKELLDFWDGSFMPLPPRSLSEIKWFFNAPFKIFEKPIGLPFVGLAALGFIVGCRSLFPTVKFAVLIFPLIVTFLASGFHMYPIHSRLLLFLNPSMIILIASGLSIIYEMIPDRSKIIGRILIILLFLNPGLLAINNFINPVRVEETRPVINYLNLAKQDGDKLYLYYKTYFAFRYYQERFGYPNNDFTIGIGSRGNWNPYLEDLDNLRGHKRVWIIFSHVYRDESVDEEKLFLFYLNNIGRKIDSYKQTGASAYLYDLSQPDEFHLSHK